MQRKKWIAHLSKEIQGLSATSFFGSAPSLNWDSLSASLGAQLGIPSFSISPGKQQWREREDLKEGMEKCSIIACSISPLETPVYWMMAKNDRDKLLGLIAGDPGKKTFSSASLQEGFYLFILLESLGKLQNIDPLKQMTLQLEPEYPLSLDSPLFCIDVEISLQEHSCWGRIILTERFQKNWVQHFSAFPPEYKTTPLTKQLELMLGVRVGDLIIASKDWKKIKPGDVLLPDLTYDPKEEANSSAILMFKTMPLFQAKIQQNRLVLIDYAFTIEDSMNEQNPKTLADKLDEEPEKKKKIKDIPLHVTVELARLEITLDALMHLAAGSTLDLPLHADQKIALTVQGKKVAQAELVHLGETLGLRILEI